MLGGWGFSSVVAEEPEVAVGEADGDVGGVGDAADGAVAGDDPALVAGLVGVLGDPLVTAGVEQEEVGEAVAADLAALPVVAFS
jgi:hypothetical protein